MAVATRPKASDIDDGEVLALVRFWNDERHHDWLDPVTGVLHHRGPGSVGTWSFAEAHYPGLPEKVLFAKLSKLMKRGLIDGCNCGCRGDYTITEAGRAFLGDGG